MLRTSKEANNLADEIDITGPIGYKEIGHGDFPMQQLFLVVGGELSELGDIRFRDPATLHFVGAFPTHEEAITAWRSNAQQTVDNALMRYFVLPMHELIQHLRPLKTAKELAEHYKENALEPLD